MVTLTSSSSPSNTAFDLIKNPNTACNVSFPSYLINKEGAFMQKKLVDSKSFGLRMMNPEKDVQCEDVSTPKISKREPEEAEIGVFRAEKYFSGDMDSDTSPRLASRTNPEVLRQPTNEKMEVDHLRTGVKKSAGTPSLVSESSWNSQSLLLQNKFTKNSSCSSLQTKSSNAKANKKSFLASLRCKCVCSDGNSVDVDENSAMNREIDPGFLVQEKAARTVLSSPAKNIHGLDRENSLSFSANLNSKLKLHNQEEEIQRKSLEVFGSPIIEKRIVEKKLGIIPRDSSSSRTEERGFSVKYEEDDSGSDASSDLFEIESLKGRTKNFLARQGSDPASPTCYAPSEASIEWSVVTASAADFSVFSECATSPVRNRPVSMPKNPNPKSNRESMTQRRKSSSGFLLGCKSQKAVRVSGDSYRTVNTTPSYVPRFPTDTRPMSFESRKRISGSSISHSQSSKTASHNLLYIQ